MTDILPISVSVPAADANGQLIVAMAIVAVLGLTSIGLIVAGCITGRWDVLGIPIGTAIGSLATALNAPTGITSALRASKGAGQP